MRITSLLAVVAFALSTALVYVPARADDTSSTAKTVSGTAQLTAKIIAIDKTNRVVTLQDAQGNTYDVQAGPGIKRFDDLSVGDTVKITYQESVAIAITKPGAAAPVSEASPTVTRGTGEKPSGTVTQTQTALVTIQSIDATKPSVTVKTQDGRTLTFLVENKDNLKGFKVGDTVQITYRQALMVSVQ